MIFMKFKTASTEKYGMDSIWLDIEHIASIKGCPEQLDRTLIEMVSGSVYEVDGYSEEILKEIVNEFREN